MIKEKNIETLIKLEKLQLAKKALENGAIIPLKYDDCFKSNILDIRKHLIWFLSLLLKLDINEIEKELNYKTRELKNNRFYEKRKRVDGIFELNLININI